MSAFWDNLKKHLKIWGSAAAEKAEEFGKVAATKTEELTKISKVKLQIHQLQRDLDKNFTDLGRFVHDSADKENVTNFAGNEQFFTYINRAQELIAEIKEKEEKIAVIKKEYEAAPKVTEEEVLESDTPPASEEES